MTPVPTLLIAGLLGSGKTSLVRSVLSRSSAEEGPKVGVIVHEFGALGIDGALIRRRAGRLIELTNGCVCCASGDELTLCVRRLLDEYNPDCLAVEMSGVADCPSILRELQALQDFVVIRQILIVLDLTLAPEALIDEPLLQQHIANATILLLNKRDLCSTGVWKKWVALVQGINRKARQVTTVHGCLPPDMSLAALCQSAPAFTPVAEPNTTPYNSAGLDAHGNHPRMNSYTFTSSTPINRARLEAMLAMLGQSLDRAKGFIHFQTGSVLLNAVRGSCHFSAIADDIEVPPETGLVFMSRTIATSRLQQLCEALR